MQDDTKCNAEVAKYDDTCFMPRLLNKTIWQWHNAWKQTVNCKTILLYDQCKVIIAMSDVAKYKSINVKFYTVRSYNTM